MGEIADQMVEQAENNYDRRPMKHRKSKDKIVYPKYRKVKATAVVVTIGDLEQMINILEKKGYVSQAIGMRRKYLMEEIKDDSNTN